ncbi:hypothetical protein AQUSIP_24540 [Aquicella siphonis]|uniref:L,D-TPase catalytic domain-containing protein n=1 Tax=Aquicella siphonis TaxID=254247 RepID=A0A5E4PL70_9COXI|nr:L,D-transpeptidase [Aquicella siphonis]VVC77127.1 hypothetical protein AQUSIP_24540 [Aquicella siphonis]
MQTLRMLAVLFTIPMLLYPFSAYSKKIHHRSLPSQIAPLGEKVIIIDPNIHAFGAYNANGVLVRSGMVTAGGYWCKDIKRRCLTKAGSFRIYSLGGPGCKSHKYPLPHGGAPMPYCMFFNGSQGLHGSYQVVYGNISHGCVRLHVADAKWLRYHFVQGPSASNGYRGTRVIVRPY